MRAAAHIRVSSKSQTLDMHRVAIERAARACRDTIADWYSDRLSAKTLSRPGLERLRQAAREGRVPRLYVYRLDRLARSGIRDTFEVIEELRSHSCELVTVADGFDLAGPAAEVVLAVMAWAAKMERLAINERIAAARVRLELQGRSWGRPPRLTPFEKARIAERRRQGKTIREIAIAVHVPHATVGRALSHKSLPPARSARPARKRAAVAARKYAFGAGHLTLRHGTVVSHQAHSAAIRSVPGAFGAASGDEVIDVTAPLGNEGKRGSYRGRSNVAEATRLTMRRNGFGVTRGRRQASVFGSSLVAVRSRLARVGAVRSRSERSRSWPAHPTGW